MTKYIDYTIIIVIIINTKANKYTIYIYNVKCKHELKKENSKLRKNE